MPNIKSQIKRDKQNKKRTIKNKALKSRIKTAQKKLTSAVSEKNPEEAKDKLKELNKALDKAVRGSAVHKNFSTHKKSKAAKLVNSLKDEGAAGNKNTTDEKPASGKK
ncbi:MAG: 30S ribosomal protein S20 [Actinobacteria bacterium]|nr:30S ribosomal protein S20 [Actinomycetota bacterium]